MIEGSLVRLRAREMHDLDDNVAWGQDPELLRLTGDRYQQSRAYLDAMMKSYTAQPPAFAAMRFAIETKDGEHIGNLRLADVQPENRSASLSVVIGRRDFWSRGFGTDAMRALQRFVFDEMNLHRLELHVFAFNERAIACYRRAGFTEECRLRRAQYADGDFHDVIVMSILRHEWESTRAEVQA